MRRKNRDGAEGHSEGGGVGKENETVLGQCSRERDEEGEVSARRRRIRANSSVRTDEGGQDASIQSSSSSGRAGTGVNDRQRKRRGGTSSGQSSESTNTVAEGTRRKADDDEEDEGVRRRKTVRFLKNLWQKHGTSSDIAEIGVNEQKVETEEVDTESTTEDGWRRRETRRWITRSSR